MDDREYFAAKALSQSTMKLVRKSPANAKLAFENQADGDTDSLMLGRCFHARFLENKKIYVGLPEGVKKNSAQAKSILAGKMIDNPDLIIINYAKEKMLDGMIDALMSNPDVTDLMSLPGDTEKVLFWEESGVKMKGKLDKVSPVGLIDLKSAEDATEDGFSRAIYKWGLHVQAAHYDKGAIENGIDTGNEFIFIVCEKEEPYYNAVYRLDRATMMEGELERQRLIQIWQECVKNNYWPPFTRGIKQISMPKYAFKHLSTEV